MDFDVFSVYEQSFNASLPEQKAYININQQFSAYGYLLGFEVYAVRPGKLQFLVSSRFVNVFQSSLTTCLGELPSSVIFLKCKEERMAFNIEANLGVQGPLRLRGNDFTSLMNASNDCLIPLR